MHTNKWSLLTSIITRLPSIKPTTRLIFVCACAHLINIADKKCQIVYSSSVLFRNVPVPIVWAVSEKCDRRQKQHHFNRAFFFFFYHCIKTGKWKMSQPTTPLKCTRKKMSLTLRKIDEAPRRSTIEGETEREKKSKKKRTVTNGR